MAATYASPTLARVLPPAGAARTRALAAEQAVLGGAPAVGTLRTGSFPGHAIRPSRIPVAGVPIALQRCGNHPCTGDCDGHGTKLRPSALPGRTADTGAPADITDVAGITEVLRAPAAPLDSGTRSAAETFFGQSFADVRVHTDARAAATSEAVGARAYTVGTHLVFGHEQYAPGTASGARLLAHELTHVVQQSGTAAVATPRLVSRVGDPSEVEAERIGADLAPGLISPQPHAAAGTAAVSERSGPQVARDGVKDLWERAKETVHEVREGIGGIALPHGCRPIDKTTELPALTAVFGTSVDFTRVCISDALGYQGRPFTWYMSLGWCVINAGPAIYKTPGSDNDTLIHEMTHVWQSQHHIDPTAYITNSLSSQVKWGGDCYCYVPGKPFGEYGAEQIAQQVQRGEAAIRAHVKSVAVGAVDPDNVTSLATPRGEPPGTAGRKC